MANGIRAEDLMLGAFAGLLVVLFCYSYTMVRFLFRLKRFETDTWRSLGSPMIGKRDDGSTKLLVFLSTRKHQQLNDRIAVDLGNRLCFLKRVLFGCVALAVLVVGSIGIFVKP
jgi:hypothetical protein